MHHPPSETDRDRATDWLVVAAASTVQAIMAFAGMTLATMGPKVAAELDVPPAFIGYQISLVFGSGIVTSLFAGALIRRWGACRTSQVSLLMGATGCALTAVPDVATVAAASVLIGLAYGFTNPSGSHLLNRFGGRRHRNLVFSVKQAGVPLGAMVAGLVVPGTAVAVGWQCVPLAVAGLLLALTMVLQRRRRVWDDDREADGGARENPFAGLRLIIGRRPLRWLSLTGLCFTMVQLCLTGFLVTLLVEDLDFSLVEAGFVLSMVQVAAVGGRLGWGWLADRLQGGPVVLVGLGLGMTGAALCTAMLSAAWPTLLVQACFMVFGLTAIGWNGVFYAELARLSPSRQVGTVTGGALAVTYAGILIGPSLFALIHGGMDSYTATFGWVALAAVAGTGFAALGRIRP